MESLRLKTLRVESVLELPLPLLLVSLPRSRMPAAVGQLILHFPSEVFITRPKELLSVAVDGIKYLARSA